MSKNDQTKERILLSALALFAEKGIGQTNLNEVGYRAGVTRVTVYRHFPDKKELVRAAFLRIEQVFAQALGDMKQNSDVKVENMLDQIGTGLSNLPKGDVFARMDELKRLYPDVYNSVQEARTVTLNGMYDHFSTLAERGGLLRPGLNRTIVQTVFWELVINVFDNPRFRSAGLSDAELFHAITDMLLHGILKNPPTKN